MFPILFFSKKIHSYSIFQIQILVLSEANPSFSTSFSLNNNCVVAYSYTVVYLDLKVEFFGLEGGGLRMSKGCGKTMFGTRLFCKSSKKTGTDPVYLNVYDLTPINGYAYWFGLGVYHSGVQVHNVEYAFGAHENPTTGIFEVEPKQCPGFTFRKSILIGRTDMGPKEVRAFMEKLAEQYSGSSYNLITKNCNHFCNDVCQRLTGKPIPKWVNRLARLGLLCNCVLPAGLNETKVRAVRPEDRIPEKKKLRSQSTRFVSLSSPPDPSIPSVGSSSSRTRPRNLRLASMAPGSIKLVV